MKKLIIILIVLSFVGVCLAASIQDMHKAVIARKNVGGAVTYDCSGDLKFGWGMESTTLTSGTPPGCTDGSVATMTANGTATLDGTQKSNGTLSARSADAADYFYESTNFGAGEFTNAEGKIVFDVYANTYLDGMQPLEISYNNSTNDELYIIAASSGDENDIQWKLNWTSNGTVESGNTVDSSGNITINEWTRITIKWKVSVDGNDFYIQACELTLPDTLGNCYETETDRDLVAWAGEADRIRIGQSNFIDSIMYVDNFQIFATSGY